MKSKKLREKFFNYFINLKHQKITTAPLIPAKDPTLLFTNAGMNQFKDYFIGKEKRSYDKAVSIQKCLRVSGKHNDFDEVGKTDHHHTFFEMMGNFSFGDYFKQKAIKYGWDFLTNELDLSPEKLWISVYQDDEDAYNIWKDQIGIPEEKILRLGKKDNFWQMGDVGPCGPCSEIHYDRGENYGEKNFLKSPDRFVEIWNLVFMQFNREKNGDMTPLAQPSIDTGMGLERLSAIMQNVSSNYDTDLFIPIKKYIADLIQKDYLDASLKIDLNIVADHARAITFLISDSILPSNDGRGYVLRRILRRAAKHGKSLGLQGPFLSKICLFVIELMCDFYPELETNKELIRQVVDGEELRFEQTLSRGLIRFEALVKNLIDKKKSLIPGQDLFTLSDTYGFPLDFASDLAAEYNLQIDHEGFNQALNIQRERSQKSQKINKNFPEFQNLNLPKTSFTGFSSDNSKGTIQAIFTLDKKQVSNLKESEEGIAIFDQTPFYAESGGQIADIGTGKGEQCFIEISDVQKINDYYLHFFKITKGTIQTGQQISLNINSKNRFDISTHHTATHILHWALKEILGLHVKQAGSHVTPDRLRFDFTHFKGLNEKELQRVETLVNQKIQENQKVHTELLDYDTAINKGAMAIFDEKYSDIVRMVAVGDFSKELCGGLHLEYSGQAGFFTIIEESSISAGIRRIEAKSGTGAVRHSQKNIQILRKISRHFNQKNETLFDFLLNIEKDNKMLKKKFNQVSSQTANIDMSAIIKQRTKINDIPILISHISTGNKKQLGALADSIKKEIKGIVILFSNLESKSLIIASIDSVLSKKFNANEIIKKLAELIDGRGGGKNDFAQAGGNYIEEPKIFSGEVLNILDTIIKKT